MSVKSSRDSETEDEFDETAQVVSRVGNVVTIREPDGTVVMHWLPPQTVNPPLPKNDPLLKARRARDRDMHRRLQQAFPKSYHAA